MFRRLYQSLRDAERRLAASGEIATPRGRRRAFWHYHLADVGFLRVLWTNLYEIAPGVWRSNQPSAARLRRYHRMGIRAILNLRGAEEAPHYLFEREAAGHLGIELIDIRLRARKLDTRETFLNLFDRFDHMPRPFVMHCKSGADRAGLASALWLMDQEGVPVETARRQLHWRYLHLSRTDTGILDFLLDAYGRDCRVAPMPVRDWFRDRYDPRALTAAFRAGRAA